MNRYFLLARTLCLVAVPVLLVSASMHASISYGPQGGWWNIDNMAPLGQTFTAFSDRVSRIGCWVGPHGYGSAIDIGLHITLYEGSGFGGVPMATRSAQTPPPDPGGTMGTWGQGWADAWFSGIELQPGDVYSIRLSDGSSSGVIGSDIGYWDVGNSNYGSVYTDGVSIRYGVVDYTWEDLAFRVLDPLVANGGFSSGTLNGWNTTTSGNGSAAAFHKGGGDYAALLTSGSEVGIKQAVNTPGDPFYLFFDHAFQSAGVLDVFLDSVPVFHAEASQAGADSTEMIRIADPSLLGATGVDLAFGFDGQTGSQILLDNIYISEVPEPAMLSLLALGVVAIICRRRTA